MQTDLLSTQPDERAESVSTQEVGKPTESAPMEETATLKPSPMAAKKRSKLVIASIGMGLFGVLLLVSFAWVGYWAYTLNTQLTAIQQQFTALQSEYAKLRTEHTILTSEHDKLNAELSQTKADLEKANTDLTTAQADLSKFKNQGEKLDAQIEAAGKLAEVLFVISMSDNPSDVFKVDGLIKETNNQQLIDKWNTFTRTPSEDGLNAFMEYLILAIRNSVR
jgi:septal ring factor EnvC (AmiA/AmiB activator)